MSAYKRWQIGLGIAVAVFTLVGLLILYKQNDLIEGQNRLMEFAQKQETAQLRAWVAVRNPIQPVLEVGKPATSGVVFFNAGPTPALGFRAAVGFGFTPANEQFVPRYAVPANEVSSDTVLPSQVPATYTATLTNITDEVIARLTDGTIVAYIYATYSFRDVFGNRYDDNTFCAVMRPDLKTINACAFYNDIKVEPSNQNQTNGP